ncbi:MAG: hypothetical protein L0387_45575 [Acidobacteria bacterium]|nr:hypothetical protein [Acidobacteriota bacterium]
MPVELESEHRCVLHFILSVEQVCTEMRHEAAEGRASTQRLAEIATCLTERSVMLSHAATGSVHLSDWLKKRVLNTFLTLMNTRESIDRATAHRIFFPDSELRIGAAGTAVR